VKRLVLMCVAALLLLVAAGAPSKRCAIGIAPPDRRWHAIGRTDSRSVHRMDRFGSLYSGIATSQQEWPVRTLHSGYHFLPPYANPRDRFGFDSGSDLTTYAVEQLQAGWYSDWNTNLNPPHPDGLTYVQLVRLHAGADPQDPTQVTVAPSPEIIAQIAAAHPGSLWLLGNEPDSLYCGSPIYPAVYAHVYHDVYTTIKALDPSALIANGAVVQPTPCRLEYLDIVWDTYVQAYGEPMPVDVWNTHAFILREVYGSWGASTPPGVDPGCGVAYPVYDGDNVDVMRDHLVALRQWMKDKGEQNKPLIISEYGVLWPEWFVDERGQAFTAARVSQFMTQTYDLFLNETYPDIGLPQDEYRLVQAWAWYSLSDDQDYNGYLFHSNSKEISPIGQAYADYTAALTDTQYTDLTAQLWADVEPLAHLTPTLPYDAPSEWSLCGDSGALTATLPVTGIVANLGPLTATGVVIACPGSGCQLIQDVPGRYVEDIAPLPLPTLAITAPGVYDLSLVADAPQSLPDVRRWNNSSTVSVDARADLTVLEAVWCIHSQEPASDVLSVTLTVENEGLWPTPPISGALHLNNAQGSLVPTVRQVSVPAMGSRARAVSLQEMPLPGSSEDLYRLTIDVDSAAVLDEQDESNNQAQIPIPIVVTTTLQPTATGALTSASGHTAFLFPATSVTLPTEIRFTPLLTSELPPGPPLGVSAFDLRAYRGGEPVSPTLSCPITVTWQYSDTEVTGLYESGLGLYSLASDGLWQRVYHPVERHDLEMNRLSTCVHHLGTYVFGQGDEIYFPSMLLGPELGNWLRHQGLEKAPVSPAVSAAGSCPSGLPPRLTPNVSPAGY